MFYRSRIAATTRKGERNLGLIDGTWLASVMDESRREMERDDCRAIRFLSKHTIITLSAHSARARGQIVANPRE
jgi:hypothetical protein